MKVARKLLVVDDDPAVVSLLVHLFMQHGIEASGEIHSEKALQRIQCSDYRVVITDIDMPIVNGLELLNAIQQYDRTIQVIMITGHATFSNLASAFQGGAQYIVEKPIADHSELFECVHRAFENLDHWSKMISRLRSGAETKQLK